MLFYFHGGDLPLWMIILFLLFGILVPLAISLLMFSVINSYLKWKKGKVEKNNYLLAPRD